MSPTARPPILVGGMVAGNTHQAAWYNDAFGPHTPGVELQDRRYDVPWIAIDNRDDGRDFHCSIRTPLPAILEEIAAHARQHPEWLETSGGRAASRTRTAPN